MRGVRDVPEVHVVDRYARVVVPAEQVCQPKLHLFLLVKATLRLLLLRLGVWETELLTVVVRPHVDVLDKSRNVRALGDEIRKRNQRRHRLLSVVGLEPVAVVHLVAAPALALFLLELDDGLVRPGVVDDVHVGARHALLHAIVGAEGVALGELVCVDEFNPELGPPREPVGSVEGPGGCLFGVLRRRRRRLELLRGVRDLSLDVHLPLERVENLAALVRVWVAVGEGWRVVRRRVGRGASVARSCARARARLALGPARAPARLAAFALAVCGLLLRRADRVRPWHLPDAARLQRDVAEAAGSCRRCCAHGRGRVVRGPDSGPVALVPAHAGLAAGSLAQGGQVQVPVEPAAAQRGARDEHQPQRGRADGCEQPIRFLGPAARGRSLALRAYRRRAVIADARRGVAK